MRAAVFSADAALAAAALRPCTEADAASTILKPGLFSVFPFDLASSSTRDLAARIASRAAALSCCALLPPPPSIAACFAFSVPSSASICLISPVTLMLYVGSDSIFFSSSSSTFKPFLT
uniref:Uncharacterized protein n=1 Tax=Opuntia streptacantha TaxID=393608 RepID=A0A7C9CDL3_OPUST